MDENLSQNESATSPRPPFAEPAFYFAERGTEEAFSLVVEYLAEKGASFGMALLGGKGNADEMADLIQYEIERVSVANRRELETVRRATGRAVAGVTLSGVQPGGAGRDVEVRVLPIPEDAVGIDRHPIALWCDGSAFELHTPMAPKTRRSEDLLDLFVSVVAALSPAYGSLLISWPLPGPTEVAARPDGFEFADFYVSADYVGRPAFNKMTSAIDRDHQKSLDSGALFLTSGLFSSTPTRNIGVGRMAAGAIAAVGHSA
ncbi:hypothetical protein [Frankia sp. Cas3]|uniref:hypothetical protein n=1 Tax=Frankia sp. Cas3 TaxID=3073926 RepID=UPI002AD4491B|nr:hypothetical protein [Frankia sp. Cas3]